MQDLITLEEYKLSRGIGKQDQDQQIALFIKSASDIIQTYLGTDFLTDDTAPVTEVISNDYETDVIYLDHYPIQEVTSVQELNTYLWDSTVHFPVPANNYVVDKLNGKLIRLNKTYWGRGPGAVIVTYTKPAKVEIDFDNIEHPSDVVPPAIKQATIDLVTYYLKGEYTDVKQLRGAVINNTGGGYSSRFNPPTQFPAHIQRILDMYKKDNSAR